MANGNRGHHFATRVNRHALALPRSGRRVMPVLPLTTSRCVSCRDRAALEDALGAHPALGDGRLLLHTADVRHAEVIAAAIDSAAQ